MAVGDTYTSSLSFSLDEPEKNHSKPPHNRKPPKPTPQKPPRKRYTSSTEYAKVDNLEASTPTMNPDAIVPFLIGTQRAFSPQCIWYGNLRTKYEKEVREETETTTERKKLDFNEFEERQVVTVKKVTTYTPVDFYMTVVVGLALGPHVRLKAIYADNELIWSGTTVDGKNDLVLTSKLAPFRAATFYSGRNTETPDPFLESLIGVGNVPAFVGTSYLIIPTIASKDYGSSSLSYEIERTEFNVNIDGVTDVTNANGDVNAAAMVYEILRSDWSALGLSTGDIDDASFLDFFDKCAARNYYFSFIEATEDFGTGYIETISGLIGAIFYVDLESEKIKVNTYYAPDFDPDDAITFDENDLIDIQELSRTDWQNMPTHYAIDFSSRRDNYKKVKINRLGHSVNQDDKKSERRQINVRAALATERDVARALLTRSIMHNGVPIMEMDIRTNTKGNQCVPGSVILLNWQKYGMVNAPFWVTNIKNTDVELNQVVLQGYYFGRASVDDFDDDDGASDWEPISTEPVKPVNVVIVAGENAIPPNALIRFGVTAVTTGTTKRFASYGLLLARAENDQQVAMDVTTSFGLIVKRNVPYCASGFLADAIGQNEQAANGYLGDVQLTYATNLAIVDDEGGIAYCNGEWFSFTHVTRLGGGNAVVHNVNRGIWGTEMVAHAVDDVFYMMDDSDRKLGPYTKGEKKKFNLLSVAYGGRADELAEIYQTAQIEFFSSVNEMDAPITIAVNGARWYPGDTPTIYTGIDQFVTWQNQYRRSTTADGINDGVSSYEDLFDATPGDVYHAYLIDSVATEWDLGESYLASYPASDIGFTSMTLNLDPLDFPAGPGIIRLRHDLARATSRTIEIPVIIADLPGVIAELSLDYRMGFVAELSTDYAIVN